MTNTLTIYSKKKIKETLRELMTQRKIHSGTAFAKILNIPGPTINRILSGQVTDPRASTLSLLADYFSVSIDQLLGKVPLNTTETDDEPTQSLAFLSIPIVTSLNCHDFQQTMQKPRQWYRWTTHTPSKHPKVFALHINTHILEPTFQAGTLLVINPSLQAKPFNYVALRFEQDPCISIRKIMTDGRCNYFHPLQPGHKIFSVDDMAHHIMGVVIEAHIDLAHFN